MSEGASSARDPGGSARSTFPALSVEAPQKGLPTHLVANTENSQHISVERAATIQASWCGASAAQASQGVENAPSRTMARGNAETCSERLRHAADALLIHVAPDLVTSATRTLEG